MMHQDVADLLTPQIKEMHESLIRLGQLDEANKLIEDAVNGLVDGTTSLNGYEYIAQKVTTARNLLVHVIADSMEKNTCCKKENPCEVCLMQARDIMPDIWLPIILLMRYMEHHSGLTIYQIVETFIKKLESDPGTRFEAMTGIQAPSLKIIKAPKTEENK